MKCLKCGAEIKAPAVFCADCLKKMEQEPVDRDAKLVLPARLGPSAEPRPQRPKPQPKPEEVIAHQRGLIRRLRITAACLLALSLILGVLLFFFGHFDELPAHALGQNFKTAGEETTAPTEPSQTQPGAAQ